MVCALILDDDPLYRAMIQSMLERSGYFVAVAENGVQCLALLDLMRFDVIIVDLLMSQGKSGELREVIRENKHAIPVVGVVEGFARAVEAPTGWEVAAVVAKPFREVELLSALDQVLGERR
ncbi:hypothetical protein TSO221_22620 [Azospirillum sp. TSO22-1]|nr:hypothetical protein TSO221_22620 [Azospirillum sp. TSO22-1]